MIRSQISSWRLNLIRTFVISFNIHHRHLALGLADQFILQWLFSYYQLVRIRLYRWQFELVGLSWRKGFAITFIGGLILIFERAHWLAHFCGVNAYDVVELVNLWLIRFILLSFPLYCIYMLIFLFFLVWRSWWQIRPSLSSWRKFFLQHWPYVINLLVVYYFLNCLTFLLNGVQHNICLMPFGKIWLLAFQVIEVCWTCNWLLRLRRIFIKRFLQVFVQIFYLIIASNWHFLFLLIFLRRCTYHALLAVGASAWWCWLRWRLLVKSCYSIQVYAHVNLLKLWWQSLIAFALRYFFEKITPILNGVQGDWIILRSRRRRVLILFAFPNIRIFAIHLVFNLFVTCGIAAIDDFSIEDIFSIGSKHFWVLFEGVSRIQINTRVGVWNWNIDNHGLSSLWVLSVIKALKWFLRWRLSQVVACKLVQENLLGFAKAILLEFGIRIGIEACVNWWKILLRITFAHFLFQPLSLLF